MCVEYDSVKVKVVYTKKSMYPSEGGEYCLEELRALQVIPQANIHACS